MRTAVRFVAVLGAICLVMGGGVAVLYATFKERIEVKEQEQIRLALREVLPEGTVDEMPGSAEKTQSGEKVYRATDGDGNALGYAAHGRAQGYSSTVKVLVGVAPDVRTLRSVVVLDQQETPGLGANVSVSRSSYNFWQKIGIQPADEPERRFNPFLDQFSSRRLDALAGIDAMTAATITSDAVKTAVRGAVDDIRAAIGKELPSGRP
jgi:RnfABCDGE-type electron transport complex G subunit